MTSHTARSRNWQACIANKAANGAGVEMFLAFFDELRTHPASTSRR
jgi:hypothetical protein